MSLALFLPLTSHEIHICFHKLLILILMLIVTICRGLDLSYENLQVVDSSLIIEGVTAIGIVPAALGKVS